MDLEGIVSKRIRSRYVVGTTRAWLKTKIQTLSAGLSKGLFRLDFG